MTFWHRPAYSNAKEGSTPEKKTHDAHERAPDSSPLTDPPPSSSVVDLTADAQLNESLSQSVGGPSSEIAAPTESFHSTGSAAPPSSSASFPASQRILREGKEVVISSDGEESDSTLEDPSVFLAPKSLPKKTEPIPTNKEILSRPPAPKKYTNSITSLFNSAKNESEGKKKLQEVEDELSQMKATYQASGQHISPGHYDAGNKGIQENMVASAFSENEEGPGLHRLLDAVRRTEALDQDRAWRFFDQNLTPSPVFEFPRDLISPGSNIAALREPDSRARFFESGILEFASSLHRLPDGLIRWVFLSIPFETQDVLRAAYCRVFAAQTSPERVGSLIRPDDIDSLFWALGARPQALNVSETVVEDPSGLISQAPRLQNRSILVSIFDLLRDSQDLFADDTLEHVIHILLRMTLDTSLTADAIICSELQSCLTYLLENVPEAKIKHMEQRICTTLFQTIQGPQFQSRLLLQILPTSTWISLLRYRLATAFLLQSPSPLTEPPTKLLDLERLTNHLSREKRFQLKTQKSKMDYDYGELTALAILLDIVINSTLFDLGHHNPQDFDAAIDKLARKIKNIYSSIEDTGASHLRRLLAKEALEALHYRMIYSVRSKPPPKKTLFATYATQRDGDIKSHFKTSTSITIATGDAHSSESPDGAEGTRIPIRGHS